MGCTHTHTHTQKRFFLPPPCYFFLYPPLSPFFQPLSLSLAPIWGIMVKKKKKKKKKLYTPMSPTTTIKCILCYRAAVCLLSVWCGGWGGRGGRKSGGEAKLGAQGYNRKTRAGGEGRGLERMGSSGVAHGEQRYLINTNARSKLFRQGL